MASPSPAGGGASAAARASAAAALRLAGAGVPRAALAASALQRPAQRPAPRRQPEEEAAAEPPPPQPPTVAAPAPPPRPPPPPPPPPIAPAAPPPPAPDVPLVMAPGHICGRFDKLRRLYTTSGRGPKRRGGDGGGSGRRRTNDDADDNDATDQSPPPPFDENAWRDLVAQAVAAGPLLRPPRWTTILYSCAKLGRREPALVAAALRALSSPAANEEAPAVATTTAAEAAAAALSMAAAEARPGAAAGGGKATGKGGGEQGRRPPPPPSSSPPAPSPLASLHGPALANLLWSLAAMGERPSDAWLAHFCAATAPVVFGPRRATRLLSRQGAAAAAAASDEQQQQPPPPPLPPLNPHQHATLLWALGALQYRAPAPYVSALLSGMRSGGGSSAGGGGDAASPAVPASPSPSSSLRGLLPSELANACWASMLRLGFLPSARWRAALLDATYPLLLLPPVVVVPAAAEEREEAAAAAAAEEEDGNDGGDGGDDEEQEAETSDLLPRSTTPLTDHQLACLVWSWASVRARPPRRWLERLALSLAPGQRRKRRQKQRRGDGGNGDGNSDADFIRRPGRAASMPSRQLSVLLCGLAKMGATLPERAMEAVCWRVVRLCSSSSGGGGVGGVGGGNNSNSSSPAISTSSPPLDDLAALCWSLPRLARPDSREWGRSRAGAAALRALAAAALPRLPEARSARPLAQLLVGLAAGGHNPGVLWLKTHQNACAALPLSSAVGGGGGGGGGGDDGAGGSGRRGLHEDNRDRMRRALRALVMET